MAAAVGRGGLVYCLRIAVFIPSAYLCPLFISLISLLSTFLEPSALPPHSLQCSEVDTEGKHTLNLQWPGSPEVCPRLCSHGVRCIVEWLEHPQQTVRKRLPSTMGTPLQRDRGVAQ